MPLVRRGGVTGSENVRNKLSIERIEERIDERGWTVFKMEIGVAWGFLKAVVFREGNKRKRFPLARSAKKETVRVETANEIKRMGPKEKTIRTLKFMYSVHHGKKMSSDMLPSKYFYKYTLWYTKHGCINKYDRDILYVWVCLHACVCVYVSVNVCMCACVKLGKTLVYLYGIRQRACSFSNNQNSSQRMSQYKITREIH